MNGCRKFCRGHSKNLQRLQHQVRWFQHEPFVVGGSQHAAPDPSCSPYRTTRSPTVAAVMVGHNLQKVNVDGLDLGTRSRRLRGAAKRRRDADGLQRLVPRVLSHADRSICLCVTLTFTLSRCAPQRFCCFFAGIGPMLLGLVVFWSAYFIEVYLCFSTYRSKFKIAKTYSILGLYIVRGRNQKWTLSTHFG